MTAVAEATEATTNTFTFPRTVEEWTPLLNTFLDEKGWGDVVRRGPAAEALAAASAKMTDLSVVSEDSIRSHVITPWGNDASYYVDFGESDQSVFDWIMGLVEDAQNASVPEVEPVVGPDGIIRMLPLIEEMMPMWRQTVISAWGQARFDQIVEIMESQYDHWRRGKYKVSNLSRAEQQFHRRFVNKFSTSLRYDSSINRGVNHILGYLQAVTNGEEAARTTIEPTQGEYETRLVEDGIYLSSSAYYLAYVGHRLGRYYRRNSNFTTVEDAIVRFKNDLASHVSESSWEEDDTPIRLATDVMREMYLNQKVVVEGIEHLVDAESFLDWQMGHHEGAGTLHREAIRDAILDYVDLAKTEPERLEGEGHYVAFKRMVVAYGFTKYTGKVSRTVLSAVLAQVFEAVKGQGLTNEEWVARFERRDRMISYVSGRYGEVHRMCERLEDACKELGVKPIRKPEHKVRFKGSGVIVEISVDSWWDDETRLQNAAKTKWGNMTQAERDAAVVERLGTYVNWGDMQVAR